MIARQRVRTTGRFTPAYALASAIVILGAGLAASVNQDRIFGAQRERELTVQAEILSTNVTAALVFGDANAVRELVGALAVNPEIEAAGVYDSSQLLVAGFVRRGKPRLPRSAHDRVALASGRSTVVVVPVRHQGPLGVVCIRAIDEPIARRLTRHSGLMLLAVMAALLVGFLGTSQRTLRAANDQLEARARTLAETNRLLQNEMEERSKAEDALRQSQKMEAVGQLSGGIAHDFNNLLTIIQGNLHLLRKEAGQDLPSIQTYVVSAGQAVERAGHLVRRLLAFSRRQPLSPRRVDLCDLVNGMKDLILHSVGDGVQVEWRLNSTWKTYCDVNQMENVILNLAINARDAMPEGGLLTVETSDVSLDDDASASGIESGDYVEVRMRDTGTGMTDEVRKRAVDPFFTTKAQGQGTGLGLSMAFAFIRQSNGMLNIETAPGAGTTVLILLPRHEATQSVEAV